jgi:cytochrome c-type biogenesis protein CcmE
VTPRDELDEDLPPVDLTPRAGRTGKSRTAPVVVALVLVVVALGFIAVKSLGSASMFFYNADEAVAHRDDLGDRRFRLQGTVEDGSVHQSDDSVEFVVFYGGAEVEVVHRGDPPELFQPNIPVVLEGNWEGDHFASDRIMVKHSEVYVEENPERLEPVDAPAADGATADSGADDSTTP